MYFGAAAIAAGTQQRVRCRNPNLVTDNRLRIDGRCVFVVTADGTSEV